MRSVDNRYFMYLCRLMRLSLPEHRDYGLLMEKLYDTDFFWVHPLDENRLIDGMELREAYLRVRGEELLRPYNCLEVLAAFSKRIEENILGEPGNDKIERMFWVMLSNLGLLEFTDYEFDEQKVTDILQKWLTRNDKSVHLFPLKMSRRDESELDFWWQMQLYVDENY